MNKVILTNHAYDRMKERVGIGKKAADRLSEKAYAAGIDRNSVKGRLQKYIESKELRNSSKCKIYGEMVYCFSDNCEGAILMTVFWIPTSLRKQALGAQRKLIA
jgi:hypothetical protein